MDRRELQEVRASLSEAEKLLHAIEAAIEFPGNVTRQCPVCHFVFTVGKVRHKIYCSTKCRSKARYLQKPEKWHRQNVLRRQRWAEDPEYRKGLIERRRQREATPESRQRKNEQIRLRRADDAAWRRQNVRDWKRWKEDPEYRRCLIEYHRQRRTEQNR